jgi:hypothetical protein
MTDSDYATLADQLKELEEIYNLLSDEDREDWLNFARQLVARRTKDPEKKAGE